MKKYIDLIKNENLYNLINSDYLEFVLLPSLGLNNRHIEQYPDFLHRYCGKGLQSWQYPNQFSKYLVYISKLAIKSYVEIGCHKGGTVAITIEYLSRFNMINEILCVDSWYRSKFDRYCKSKKITYLNCNSKDKKFKKVLSKNNWDLVFIDGNHSYEMVKSDYNTVKKHAKYVVLHDICNEYCPGVVKFWKQIKNNNNNWIEWNEQYSEVTKKHEKKIMGIGLVKI